MTANVPTMATGTAISGMIAARQFCRNTSTTSDDQDHRVAQRLEDLVDRFADERRRVVDDLVVEPVGKAGLQLLHLGVHLPGGLQGVGAGQLEDDSATEGRPSSVQDWSYCCEPSSTRATSRSRTMPVDCGGGALVLDVVCPAAPVWPAASAVPAGLAGRAGLQRLRHGVALAGLDDDVGELLRDRPAGPAC